MQGVGTVDGHRNVLEKFDVVSRAYMSLTPAQQRVIVHNLNETSQGMVKYLQHPIVTMNDYNDYCYFVAGTVGIAISNMYLVTGYPLPAMDNHHRQHCINVGLLLQKVNIIRDVREDTMEGAQVLAESVVGAPCARHSYVAATQTPVPCHPLLERAHPRCHAACAPVPGISPDPFEGRSPLSRAHDTSSERHCDAARVLQQPGRVCRREQDSLGERHASLRSKRARRSKGYSSFATGA